MLSTTFASDLLKLIFNGTPIAGLADNAQSGALANLQLSLHTADPGAGGNQATSEVNYTGYSRLAVARGGGGFTVTGVQVNPTSTLEFGEMTAGTNQTATHMCIGTATSGAGKNTFRFVLSPPVECKPGVTPRLRTTTTLTAVTS